ncbi:ArnT family glycosyltransferase [Rhodoferax sp.]|uniref:ArnT family glycosyltransferase n=1 Tax=Rhodoferax sp. TaxID=50421 RepID=UPI0027644224|nr:glycosyltransferase family 39 protein [Rhodoferax sp.]
MNGFLALTERRKSWLALALLWALLLGLAALRPLAVPDEGRYGEIGRWMLQSGDWLTPRVNGIPFFHKPPYIYWLEAMALATWGVNAWALRWVPALHAGLMLVALYLAARGSVGETTARRAAIMLGSSLSFLLGGQYVNHDMAVAAWIGVAIWCFALAFVRLPAQRSSSAGPGPAVLWLARLGFVACGLGFLSKGLIGIALPGLVLLIWLLWTGQVRKIVQLPWLTGLTLLAVVSLPWLVLAHQQFPDMLSYMFGKHQVGRYTATTFNNARAWWFYLPVLLVLLFPWVFFALVQAAGQVQRTYSATNSVAKSLVLLCWIWLLAILVFFSVPNSKLMGYVLPVMPALALLAALGFERWPGDKAFAPRVWRGLLGLALVLAVVANVAAGRFTAISGTADIARVLACEAGAEDRIYILDRYPYDLPFLRQARQPMIAVQDWPTLRRSAGDGWQRELFEGAEFDRLAGAVLQTPDVLPSAARTPGNWLVMPRDGELNAALQGPWRLHHEGVGWRLLRSAGGPGSAPKGPEAAQHKGLPGCK